MIRNNRRSYGPNRIPPIHAHSYYRRIERALEEVADPDVKVLELTAREEIDRNSILAANSAIMGAYINSQRRI